MVNFIQLIGSTNFTGGLTLMDDDHFVITMINDNLKDDVYLDLDKDDFRHLMNMECQDGDIRMFLTCFLTQTHYYAESPILKKERALFKLTYQDRLSKSTVGDRFELLEEVTSNIFKPQLALPFNDLSDFVFDVLKQIEQYINTEEVFNAIRDGKL